MTWNNDNVMTIIEYRSMNLTFLTSKQPEPPENNSLIDNEVRLKAVQLRLKLNEVIQDDNSPLVRSMTELAVLSSNTEPLEENHGYSSNEIAEFLQYHSTLETYRELNNDIKSFTLGDKEHEEIPSFSMIYSTRKRDNVLVHCDGEHIRPIGLEENDMVMGELMNNWSYNYQRIDNTQIRDVLEDINFDSLRRRLLNAGFDKLVESIDNELENNF